MRTFLPDPEPDDDRGGFYVSVLERPGGRWLLALGPFVTHGEAAGRVRDVKRYVREHYTRHEFYLYGTCRVTEGEQTPGVLNAKIGVVMRQNVHAQDVITAGGGPEGLARELRARFAAINLTVEVSVIPAEAACEHGHAGWALKIDYDLARRPEDAVPIVRAFYEQFRDEIFEGRRFHE